MFGEENDVRVLCVSPAFLPAANAEAFCGGKMVKALVEASVDVAVLCTPVSPGHPADDSPCWKQLRTLTHPVEVPPTWRGDVGQIFLEACHGLSYRNVGFGRYIKNYVRRAAELHREKRFDLVYSRSLPMIAHVAGYWCSQSLHLPWIANINDPWDMHLFPDIVSKRVPVYRAVLSRYWLRRTLRCANLITYPSSHLHAFHVQLAAMEHRAAVIPHVGRTVHARQDVMSTFRLVHTGKLGVREFTGGRSTSGLFTGLARFLSAYPSARAATRVILVGPEDPATSEVVKRLELEDVVQGLGRMSYEESLASIASASVCVLVEGRMTEGIYFPSKLADYVAACKPILALSPARGVVAELARKGGIRRVDTDDEEAIAAALGDFYRAFLGGRLQEHRVSDVLVHQVNPHAVVEKFLHATEYACRSCRKHRS